MLRLRLDPEPLTQAQERMQEPNTRNAISDQSDIIPESPGVF
jgi:hypothetical protein